MKKDIRSLDLSGSDSRFSSWHKSPDSSSTNGCVEISSGKGDMRGFVGMRDSKNPEASALAFSSTEWKSFLQGVKEGSFDNM